MRFLEVRRHTMRVKPGQHLSQSGVTLARRVGETLGPFDQVYTSTIPRAYETAVAMGFAVTEQIPALGEMSEAAGKAFELADGRFRWDTGFAHFADLLRQGGPAAAFMEAQATLWRSFMETLPDGGRVLVVTHGGFVEAGTVACLQDQDVAQWGWAIDYCEGVRLAYGDQGFVQAELRRVQF
jgi:broad specificity phosphatase PhoE